MGVVVLEKGGASKVKEVGPFFSVEDGDDEDVDDEDVMTDVTRMVL